MHLIFSFSPPPGGGFVHFCLLCCRLDWVSMIQPAFDHASTEAKHRCRFCDRFMHPSELEHRSFRSAVLLLVWIRLWSCGIKSKGSVSPCTTSWAGTCMHVLLVMLFWSAHASLLLVKGHEVFLIFPLKGKKKPKCFWYGDDYISWWYLHARHLCTYCSTGSKQTDVPLPLSSQILHEASRWLGYDPLIELQNLSHFKLIRTETLYE